ncbi:hypothetical protein SKAU_G00370510 [Synaphobranchus kaupii]|uniref:BHLH domain-containing protein n=1 Tax=Synaphobranchus kaupii TaxID=118154 RepID=A0A9Q1IEY4_SYNKA|nr:hypothetical protein SKAU_G00370510 [Synaphobranchus kaupii]
MKTITAELPDQKDVRRVPKPLMEKRRRDRINNSLETLRLLLLENTHNEKLRNPKVEKAEILESVVHFLKAEQEGGREPWPVIGERRDKPGEEDGEVKSPSKRQHSYHEGMRTCLLRVGHFIAAKSHELDDSSEECPPVKSPLNQVHSLPYPPLAGETHFPISPDLESKSGLRKSPLQTLPKGQPASPCSSLGVKRLPQARVCPTISHVLSNSSSGVPSCKSSAVLSDTVWRPWPQ